MAGTEIGWRWRWSLRYIALFHVLRIRVRLARCPLAAASWCSVVVGALQPCSPRDSAGLAAAAAAAASVTSNTSRRRSDTPPLSHAVSLGDVVHVCESAAGHVKLPVFVC